MPPRVEEPLVHRSKIYTNACADREPEYSAYEQLQIAWGEQDNYEVVRKVGRGKYSEVFEGVNVASSSRCIIKILKPVKKKKILREVKILQNLQGGPNVITYGLELDPQQEALLGSHNRKPWSKFVTADNQHLASPEAIDFIDRLLRYDHQHRITSKDALNHPYFDPVRTPAA
ncbi:Casein kinase II subunit alpha [Tetrabaena socialis]|uniref:non-specific serine/threonine protein kinase n=1 Tax=Tetrabaena socialis TaxID=47790 RepID=A0A2J7ZTF3_9CHLO|nr:Casein kinase II subunit alpha [Tetrabaena socialis]|eukprot:PNH03520.1 Casein kinase II subunit alpha [Tetrabaena socialis]